MDSLEKLRDRKSILHIAIERTMLHPPAGAFLREFSLSLSLSLSRSLSAGNVFVFGRLSPVIRSLSRIPQAGSEQSEPKSTLFNNYFIKIPNKRNQRTTLSFIHSFARFVWEIKLFPFMNLLNEQ